MAEVASHLAGTSALARLNRPAVAAVLAPLIEAGLEATCGAIGFELGQASRGSAESDLVRANREEGYEWLAIHDEDGLELSMCGAYCGAPATCGRSAFPTCWSPQSRNARSHARAIRQRDLISQVTRQPIQREVPRGTVP